MPGMLIGNDVTPGFSRDSPDVCSGCSQSVIELLTWTRLRRAWSQNVPVTLRGHPPAFRGRCAQEQHQNIPDKEPQPGALHPPHGAQGAAFEHIRVPVKGFDLPTVSCVLFRELQVKHGKIGSSSANV